MLHRVNRALPAILPAVEPTPAQIERASDALVPFVQAWNLSLNPEELAEIAYAVLVHHDSDATWEEMRREAD